MPTQNSSGAAKRGIGYSVGKAGLKLTPSVGVFLYQRDNDRYYIDDKGGSELCRDSTNGRYADKEKCDDIAATAYGQVEATYTIPCLSPWVWGQGSVIRFGPMAPSPSR